MDNTEALLDSLLIPEKRLDFMAEIPCPVKLAVHEKLDPYLSVRAGSFTSYIPTTCGLSNTAPGREILGSLSHCRIEDMPQVLLSFGFRDFFQPELLEKCINPRYYSTAQPQIFSKAFDGLGLADPEGVFSVFSTLPMIMVVDRRHLGDLPVPKAWSDILSDRYRGCISVPGSGTEAEPLTLLYIQKNFGEDGLRALARNTKQLLCGSHVAMTAGSMRPNAAPIYICTWFFANASLRRGETELVFPEDGAFVCPVYLATKKRISEPLEELSEFLLSTEFTGVYENNYYPTVSGLPECRLPGNLKMQWLGWDYVRDGSITEKSESLIARFRNYLV